MRLKRSITAVIPVKKNSSRLKNKNILPFASSNLLMHKIEQLKKVNLISRILVSSDSTQMLEMADSMDVDAIKRPTEFADESRPLTEFFDYITSIIDSDHIQDHRYFLRHLEYIPVGFRGPGAFRSASAPIYR